MTNLKPYSCPRCGIRTSSASQPRCSCGRPMKEVRCQFELAWAGPCGAPVEPNTDLCLKHLNTKCSDCGRQATKECPETTFLVCGTPLCDQCSCSQHGS